MNKSKQSKTQVQTTLAIVIATMVIGGLASNLSFAQTASGSQSSQKTSASSQANAAAAQTNSADTNAPTTEQITGAELYSIHCNRCHPERYPTERTAANWKTIMLHMQVRANLPVSQSKLILKYLQDNSGR